MLKKLLNQPKQLFLIDGLGAILSALLLFLILMKFQSYFGIPSSTLKLLASLPIRFLFYDLYCFLVVKTAVHIHLKVIAFVNLFYCLLSITLAIFHYEALTFIAWIYIITEIMIIISLVIIELNVSKAIAT